MKSIVKLAILFVAMTIQTKVTAANVAYSNYSQIMMTNKVGHTLGNNCETFTLKIGEKKSNVYYSGEDMMVVIIDFCNIFCKTTFIV